MADDRTQELKAVRFWCAFGAEEPTIAHKNWGALGLRGEALPVALRLPRRRRIDGTLVEPGPANLAE